MIWNQQKPTITHRWFKVTFVFPSWRYLSLLKGHLTIPKMSKRIARTVLFLLPLSLFVHIYWKLWKNKALRGTSPFKKTPRAVFLMLKKPGDVTLGDVLERWVCMMGSFNPQPGRIYSRMQKSMIQLPAPNPRRFLLDHRKYKQVLGWWSPSISMVLEFSLGIFVSMHIYLDLPNM